MREAAFYYSPPTDTSGARRGVFQNTFFSFSQQFLYIQTSALHVWKTKSLPHISKCLHLGEMKIKMANMIDCTHEIV